LDNTDFKHKEMRRQQIYKHYARTLTRVSLCGPNK
jgi:hypothetical protein